jgi:hypothetical protein
MFLLRGVKIQDMKKYKGWGRLKHYKICRIMDMVISN